MLLLRFADAPQYSQSVASNARGPLNYTLIANYRDADDNSKYIDVAADANVVGNYNISTDWVTINPDANGAGTITMTSDNEDEVNSRSTVITLSYDGSTSNEITVTQTHK